MRAEKIRRAVKKFNNAYFMFMVMRDACGFFVANSHFPGATTMWRTGRRDKMAQKKSAASETILTQMCFFRMVHVGRVIAAVMGWKPL